MTNRQFFWYMVVNVFVAIGTIAAVVVALFGQFIPPKLEITLANPKGELAKWTKEGKEHAARYYQVKVKNKRRWSPGKNPSLNMIAVEQERPDRTFSFEWQGDVQIKWKHPRIYQQPKTIGKDAEYDLVNVNANVGAKPFVELHPIAASSSMKKVWKEGFRIRVWLQARTDEGDSPITKFEICWDGAWAETEEEMKKHFTINPA